MDVAESFWGSLSRICIQLEVADAATSDRRRRCLLWRGVIERFGRYNWMLRELIARYDETRSETAIKKPPWIRPITSL